MIIKSCSNTGLDCLKNYQIMETNNQTFDIKNN